MQFMVNLEKSKQNNNKENTLVLMILLIIFAVAHPEIRSSKAVRCRHIVGRLGSVGVVGVDVGQQGAHHRWHTWAHVFRWQAGKVAAKWETVT